MGHTALAPGTLFIELARAAAVEEQGHHTSASVVLQQLRFIEMLLLEEVSMELCTRVKIDRSTGSVREIGRAHV